MIVRLLVATLVAGVVHTARPAAAQEHEPGAPEQAERRHRSHEDRGDRRPGNHGPGMQHHWLPGGHLFQPSPEDEGPLTPDEQRELLGFVRQNVPQVYRWLKQIRRRDPAAFQQRLQEAAPRLRQLQRIFERDAQLGRSILHHAENLQGIDRARLAWRDAQQDPETQARLEGAVRRMLAENLQIEAAVLDDRVAQLKEQRTARIEAECARLSADDADLAGEPDDVREVVQRLRAAEEGAEREAARAELQELCAQRVDLRVTWLQELADHLRANAVEEVEKRLDRWRASGGRRRPPDIAPRPGRGEERESPPNRQP